MKVKVEHTINRLARKYEGIPARALRDMHDVVEHNVNRGTVLTQGIAKRQSGPHGLNYWKRISGEMTGLLEGEFGPTGDVVGNAVGAGWRGGPPNTDLPKAADIIGPNLGKMIATRAGRWFR